MAKRGSGHGGRGLCLALVCCGCASPAAGKLAGEVLSAAAGSVGPSKDNQQYRGDRRHCALWDSLDRRCPVLPECNAPSAASGARINACSRDGKLRPLSACVGNSARLCTGGEFPLCERLTGEGCWDYDTVVCRRPGEAEELLECCAPGRTDCVANTYALVTRRSATPAGGEPTVGAGEAPEGEPSADKPDAGE